MRATFKGIFVTIGLLLVVTIVGIAGSAVGNAVATENEAAELQPYGTLVRVGGKQMNVLVQGDGSQTIVLLPGLGTTAPGVDFAPLVDLLDDTYRVVVVEPFGSGLSDQTERPRTSENITNEIHAALERLKINRYVLAAHSISGIYAMQYITTYRGEVTAFVGLDTSVPVQRTASDADNDADIKGILHSLGLLRQLAAISPDPYDGLPYTDAQKQTMAVLALRNAYSASYQSEVDLAAQNFRDARKLAFPADLPVLLFYSTRAEERNWADLHTELAATVRVGEAVPIDAGHFPYHTKAAEIAAKMRDFIMVNVAAPPA